MKLPGFSSDQFQRKIGIIPKKHSDVFKAEPVRLAEDLIGIEGCSRGGAAVEISEKLGIPAYTINDR